MKQAQDQYVSEEEARDGDWVEVDSPGSAPSRRGQIIEVVGVGSHTRYRVRWDESHEGIFYPAAGVRILRL
jgi:hypothetical protein